jgi:hypothetical protein
VTIKRDNGTEERVPRLDRFRELMLSALALLRTDYFNRVETIIKNKVLLQLGFDPIKDAGKIDLYFTPIDSFDFYKSLDLLITEGGFTVSAQEMGEGMQNAIVLAILQALRKPKSREPSFSLKNRRCSCILRCSDRSTRRFVGSARTTK